MSAPTCTLTVEGAIARLTLNRPDRRNAVSRLMMAELTAACREVAALEAVRVVIVEAEGDHFSVGADLEEAVAEAEPLSLLARRRAAEQGGHLIQALQDIPQPTIAAVQGVAMGAGACIAAACDFRLAVDDARIGYGEVKIGVNLMWRALPHCVRLVGPARAKRMLLSGDLFPAETLERWGFIDEIAPREDLSTRARRWADQYAALPPLAVQMIKRSVNVLSVALDQAMMHMDADQWLLVSGSDDAREAVTAFFERRAGRFTGD